MTRNVYLNLCIVSAVAAGALSGVGMAFAAALNLSQAPVVSQAGYRSAAGVAASSRNVDAGTRLYQTRFDASDWHGDVVAYGMDGTGGLTLAWEAGALLRQTLLDERSSTAANSDVSRDGQTGHPVCVERVVQRTAGRVARAARYR